MPILSSLFLRGFKVAFDFRRNFGGQQKNATVARFAQDVYAVTYAQFRMRLLNFAPCFETRRFPLVQVERAATIGVEAFEETRLILLKRRCESGGSISSFRRATAYRPRAGRRTRLARITENLDAHGYAVMSGMLFEDECPSLSKSYPVDELFRSRVVTGGRLPRSRTTGTRRWESMCATQQSTPSSSNGAIDNRPGPQYFPIRPKRAFILYYTPVILGSSSQFHG
jgi:hypothetical protein